MQCPGQDSRFWGLDAIFEAACPQCGKAVEFFKDEPTRTCKGCGLKIVNPKMDFGCASYCQFAEQCVGDLPAELLAQRKDLFKNRVAVEMKRYFQYDFKRIGHATKVGRYAERIVKQEGGDPAVVLSAAYLHDIGIKEAERKYDDSDVRYHEEEGPPIARQILGRLKAPEALIDEVCAIISHHHHPRQEETVNFKVVYDADLIVNLEERQQETPLEGKDLAASIDKEFLTAGGRKLARNVFFKEQ
ncbi:MAG: phosphohydrolase [Deltaproteobacteria bacterium RBG_16_54_18]|jgi:putative nucleotidyltransferase with HDIG domain|nr:MAG: phosphohydrolase [Deltaproteobacteria bacterium RBG_16_54_18]